jgi:hypothetical protein
MMVCSRMTFSTGEESSSSADDVGVVRLELIDGKKVSVYHIDSADGERNTQGNG